MTYPQRFGPYVLERFLAAGGMAEVFVASRPDGRVQGPIALKRMLPQMMENPEYAAMFRDEAVLASKLLHPNIVRVFDSGEYDGRLYMAMELVDGLDASSLQKKLRAKNEMLGIAHALRIGVEVCQGLAAAHALKDERGVALMLIHRDVSPQNILIDRNGTVKVTDFGVAKATGRETHTATGNIKGKIPYMAPEQALAQAIDQRVDQFAAAIVVWELLTGSRLFQDKNDLLMFEKIIRRPTPKPSSLRASITPSIDNALLRALSKNPDERFADVAAFGRALAKCLNELGGPAVAELAPIVDYVLPPPDVTELRPASSPSLAPPSSSLASSMSQKTPQSRPTGVPIAGAALDDDNIATQHVPQRDARMPDSQPGTPGTLRPAARPQPQPLPRGAMQVTPPMQNAPTVQRSTSTLEPSQPSLAPLTLDRSRMPTTARPSGIEAGGQAGSPSGSMGGAQGSLGNSQSGNFGGNANVVAASGGVPVVAVVVAVVVGLAAGFGIAKATQKEAPAASNGCARASAATADVEAAYDLLLKSQLELESGDLAKAAARANEAQARSGTAKGHYMLGKIRMQTGDVGSGLNHYRCVFELAPSSDEAKNIANALTAKK